jgi:hypothetical protein
MPLQKVGQHCVKRIIMPVVVGELISDFYFLLFFLGVDTFHLECAPLFLEVKVLSTLLVFIANSSLDRAI